MTASYKAVKANKTLLQALGAMFTKEDAEKEEKAADT